MSAKAEQAVRAWANGRPDLTGGDGSGPLGMGAFLRSQESPASGAYAVLAAGPTLRSAPVAEDGRISVSRVTAMIYAGTEEAAEDAAVAFGNAVQSLRGDPVAAGGTGVTILVSDNMTEPAAVPMPAVGGEQFAFVVSADFVLFQEDQT